MSNQDTGEIVLLDTNHALLRDHFIGWQCRLRQYAVRHEGGRPSNGMRPDLLIEGESSAPIIVLINKREPEQVTMEFRHMVLRTPDPVERYESAVRKFAEMYFQRPQEFSDQLTALFGSRSSIVRSLTAAGRCELEFEFQRQYYRIPCTVRNLLEHEPAFQATYWHNRLFSPALPFGAQVLSFSPDWSRAKADPSPAATQISQ